MTDNFRITTKPVAHMVSQIRLKQLAANEALNKLKNFIIDCWEQNEQGISNQELVGKIADRVDLLLEQSLKVKGHLDSSGVSDLGFPSKFSKTHIQLQITKEWIASKGEKLIDDIKEGKLHNALENNINEFPTLQDPSAEKFWGNENPSVSGVMLSSIATMYDPDALNYALGSATFYPFYNPEFKLTQQPDYPFANEKGMYLFGDYQFGGHRYFSNENIGIGQLIFGPEDCTSALAKAISLPTEELLSFNTTELRKFYSKAYEDYENAPVNKYGLICVTSNNKEKGEEIDFSRIKPGQIYLYKTHTAIITAVSDDKVSFNTVEFNREIELNNPHKRSGGGAYKYDLQEKIAESEAASAAEKEDKSKHYIYIFEKPDSNLDSPYDLTELCNQVDCKYYAEHSGEKFKDALVGDCGELVLEIA